MTIRERQVKMLARRDQITQDEAAKLLRNWDQNTSSGSRKSALDTKRDTGPTVPVSARKPSLDEYDRR